MIRFPPPVCFRPVVFLRGNRHRPGISHFLRPPKLLLEGALYGTFSPPKDRTIRFAPPIRRFPILRSASGKPHKRLRSGPGKPNQRKASSCGPPIGDSRQGSRRFCPICADFVRFSLGFRRPWKTKRRFCSISRRFCPIWHFCKSDKIRQNQRVPFGPTPSGNSRSS